MQVGTPGSEAPPVATSRRTVRWGGSPIRPRPAVSGRIAVARGASFLATRRGTSLRRPSHGLLRRWGFRAAPPGALQPAGRESSTPDCYCKRHRDRRRPDRERGSHAGGHGIGLRRGDIGGRGGESERGTHHRGSRDEVEVGRQVERAGDEPSLVQREVGNDGGVVGCLEGRVAGGEDDQGSDVAGNSNAISRKG
jgi:hypothetical protein